jgi:hypothetical protein
MGFVFRFSECARGALVCTQDEWSRRILSALPYSRAEEGRVCGSVNDPGCRNALEHNLFEVVARGDLAGLAALLVEVQHPLLAGIIQTGSAERGHGTGASCGVDQNRDDGAIAKTDQVKIFD